MITKLAINTPVKLNPVYFGGSINHLQTTSGKVIEEYQVIPEWTDKPITLYKIELADGGVLTSIKSYQLIAL